MNSTEYVLKHSKEYIRFLYVTDTHFNATSPKNRKDNLLETSLVKYGEVLDLTCQYDVDFVVHGGDFFQKADVTDLVAGRVARITRKFKVPLYVVPGGHDLFGNNIDSVDRTKLGFFRQSGLVDLLIHPESDNVIIKNDKLSVQLTGTGSHYGIDYQDIDKDYVLKYKNADFAVHVIHGMLMPTPFIPNTPTVLIKDIENTLADLTLSGHYHMGFIPIDLNGKLFANCGAMVRKKNDIKEMARMPQVAIVTISKAKGIEIEYVGLKTAKPGNDVLDRTEILSRQKKNVQAQTFIGQIKNTKKMHSLDINTIIHDISTSRKLPKNVVIAALDKVSKMREIMEAGNPVLFSGKGGLIKYLIKLTLINFQSHEKTEIDLTQGINVILGESDKGKTAIIRALKWLLYNEPQGTDFVRYGTNECYVTGLFSDGYEVTRGRKKNKNIYLVKDPNGKTLSFENFGIAVPAEVIEATGVFKAQIDSDVQLAFNLNEQLDAPFLLSETGTVRAKAIGSIVKTNILDAAEREAQKDIKSLNTEIKIIDNQIKENDEKMEEFKNINKAEEALNKMELLIEKLKAKNNVYEKLKIMSNKIHNIETEMQKNSSVIAQLASLPNLEAAYSDLSLLVLKRKRLNSLNDKLKTKKSEILNTGDTIEKLKNLKLIEEKVKKLERIFPVCEKLKKKSEMYKFTNKEICRQAEILNKLKDLPKIEEKYTELKGKAKTQNNLSSKKAMLDNVAVDIKKESLIINSLKSLPEFEAKILKLSKLNDDTAKLTAIYSKKTDIENRINKGNDFISANNKSLELAFRRYLTDLKKLGKCPTCLNPITDKEIQKIAIELKN